MTSTDRPDLLAQPTRARLFAALEASDRPLDTRELAATLGLHPNSVRGQLERLHAAGLVTRARAAQPRGRPRDVWTVAPATVPTGPHIAERSRLTRRQRDAAKPAPPGAGEDYQRLAELRGALRSYLAWAEERARDFGVTAAQFQLMLAVYASDAAAGPTLAELADALLLRHHSVAGLVDRAQAGGLVARVRDPQQPARVHVQLTDEGAERFRALADSHLYELAQLASQLQALWGAFARA